jgi:hypothetical protein
VSGDVTPPTCVHEDGTEHPADLDAEGFATLPCPRAHANHD